MISKIQRILKERRRKGQVTAIERDKMLSLCPTGILQVTADDNHGFLLAAMFERRMMIVQSLASLRGEKKSKLYYSCRRGTAVHSRHSTISYDLALWESFKIAIAQRSARCLTRSPDCTW